jgi:signal recognition particle receptor subunit alpha
MVVQPRNWNGVEEDQKDLDFSGSGGSAEAAKAAVDPAKVLAERSRMEVKDSVSFAEEDKALESEMAANAKNAAYAAASAGFMGTFMASLQTRIVGKEALTAEDVQAAVEVMKKRLEQRNVSSVVASKICASVAASLEGKKLASFTGVASLVRSAMEQSITRILSPPRSTDILAEIRASKARGKPYSIVFVGVNGVGKSTNLAKVAYWLTQQNLRVMIAACDTFRCDLHMQRSCRARASLSCMVHHGRRWCLSGGRQLFQERHVFERWRQLH